LYAFLHEVFVQPSWIKHIHLQLWIRMGRQFKQVYLWLVFWKYPDQFPARVPAFVTVVSRFFSSVHPCAYHYRLFQFVIRNHTFILFDVK
jgi:hypothetical protein